MTTDNLIYNPYYPSGHPIRGERYNAVVNSDESDKPNCQRCQKQASPGQCAILGEVTEAALKLCQSAGYWDCYRPTRRDDGPYRRSAHTGAWAEILEKR